MVSGSFVKRSIDDGKVPNCRFAKIHGCQRGYSVHVFGLATPTSWPFRYGIQPCCLFPYIANRILILGLSDQTFDAREISQYGGIGEVCDLK